MKIFHSKDFGSVLMILAIFVCCGFTKINDIETAILEKDFKKAQDLAENFVKHNPKSPDLNQARYYLGVSDLGLLQYEEARKAFKTVLNGGASESLYDKAWLGVLDSLGMQERFDEALAGAEKFLVERPQSELVSIVYLKLGRTNLKLSHWDKAQTYLQKVIHDFPNSFEANTARQLLEEQRYFAIQVGSFKDQQHALVLVDELKKKGEYAYLVETKDNEGRPLYRVRVGQLTTLDEAHQMRQHLSSQGYATHIYP